MAVIGPFDFHGGYSTAYDFPVVPQGQGYATTMGMCRFRDGSVRPRWGVYQILTTLTGSLNVTGLTTWTDATNSKLVCVATSNSKVFTADISGLFPGVAPVPGSPVTATDHTGSVAASSFSGLTTFDSLNAILVGSGNSASSGAPFKITAYNVDAVLLGGSPPKGDIVKQVNNFMFISRDLSAAANQSKVYWSNVNDPETWTASNVLNFSKNDGEPIMALGSIGTDLYIFKKTSIGRLSTVTTTTSGGVTLGPLTTVIKGIGCCGPRAIDNLPNGNIVFLGYNGHFYEFDGSTVSDLSREPYPGPNVYDAAQYVNSGIRNQSLSLMIPDVNTVVKTCRGINEVYVSFTSTEMTNNGLSAMIYDFEQGIWQGNSVFTGGAGSLMSGYSYATAQVDPVANSNFTLESSEVLLFGGPSGRVYCCGDASHPYPFDAVTATTANFDVGTVVELGKEGQDFIARSICLEVTKTNATATGQSTLAAFKIFANFDTYVPTSAIYTATAGTVLPDRIFANIPVSEDSIGSHVFPKFLSVMVEGSGQVQQTTANTNPEIVRIGKFWLSDEVIR